MEKEFPFSVFTLNVSTLCRHIQARLFIAMTADAFSENVAECLAAGMNGLLPGSGGAAFAAGCGRMRVEKAASFGTVRT